MVWEACDSAKKIPIDNKTAMTRRLTLVAKAVKDAGHEVSDRLFVEAGDLVSRCRCSLGSLTCSCLAVWLHAEEMVSETAKRDRQGGESGEEESGVRRNLLPETKAIAYNAFDVFS